MPPHKVKNKMVIKCHYIGNENTQEFTHRELIFNSINFIVNKL